MCKSDGYLEIFDKASYFEVCRVVNQSNSVKTVQNKLFSKKYEQMFETPCVLSLREIG